MRPVPPSPGPHVYLNPPGGRCSGGALWYPWWSSRPVADEQTLTPDSPLDGPQTQTHTAVPFVV